MPQFCLSRLYFGFKTVTVSCHLWQPTNGIGWSKLEKVSLTCLSFNAMPMCFWGKGLQYKKCILSPFATSPPPPGPHLCPLQISSSLTPKEGLILKRPKKSLWLSALALVKFV